MPPQVCSALGNLGPQLESFAMHRKCWSAGFGSVLVQFNSLKSLSLGVNELQDLPRPPSLCLKTLSAWNLLDSELAHHLA